MVQDSFTTLNYVFYFYILFLVTKFLMLLKLEKYTHLYLEKITNIYRYLDTHANIDDKVGRVDDLAILFVTNFIITLHCLTAILDYAKMLGSSKVYGR